MRHLVLQYAWRYLLAMQQRRRVSVTCFIKVLIPWEMAQNKDACLISSRKFRSDVQFQRFEPLVAQNVMGLAQVEKLEDVSASIYFFGETPTHFLNTLEKYCPS